MKVHDLIRERLHARAGIFTRPDYIWDFNRLAKTQWSDEFEKLMRNRLIMGAFRYGLMRKQTNYRYARDAKTRIDEYHKTGNTEYLVDAANLCLLEFVEGKHPNKHFASGDGDLHSVPVK